MEIRSFEKAAEIIRTTSVEADSQGYGVNPERTAAIARYVQHKNVQFRTKSFDECAAEFCRFYNSAPADMVAAAWAEMVPCLTSKGNEMLLAAWNAYQPE